MICLAPFTSSLLCFSLFGWLLCYAPVLIRSVCCLAILSVGCWLVPVAWRRHRVSVVLSYSHCWNCRRAQHYRKRATDGFVCLGSWAAVHYCFTIFWSGEPFSSLSCYLVRNHHTGWAPIFRHFSTIVSAWAGYFARFVRYRSLSQSSFTIPDHSRNLFEFTITGFIDYFLPLFSWLPIIAI
jgi:hypothetical protein